MIILNNMPSIEKIVRKKFIDAIEDFEMLKDWDKILIAVSWWKDSLVLLDLFVWLRDYYKKRDLKLKAVHVVPQVPWLNAIEDKLKQIFERYKIDYIIHHMKIPQESRVKEGLKKAKSCQRCAYSRRISLFKLAEKLWYNKIAYWHHMDDAIDTLFINVDVWRNLKILMPVHHINKCNLDLIRPLTYLREKEIISYCKKFNIQPIQYICPIWKKWNRERIRQIVDELEEKIPNFVEKMFEAYIKRCKELDIKEALEKYGRG